MTSKPIKRWLGGVQAHATIYEDVLVPGAKILAIGDAEQSHVNLIDPEQIFYEYLARIANHLNVLRPGTAPLKFLHLGAGALTLARWGALRYPNSTHVAVDIERELLDFVQTHLPLPEECRLRTLVADARAVLHDELSGELYDVIVVDIFSGPEAPEHLTTPEYYGELNNSLAPDGLLFVNIGDDPPLAFTDRQVSAAQTAFGHVLLSSTPEMFTRRFPGNLILTASKDRIEDSVIQACQAAGPFPSAVKHSLDLDRFGKP
ncbi:spermidine synthase [Glutamicibacter arilaitensis]|uniref:spermidine synthase n=1 Tax=Glutamicibacter arilaitensis TaxID=256701 RepID=UPI00384B2B1C